VPSKDKSNEPTKRKIKPYARRDDPGAMDGVSALHIIVQGNMSNMEPPECQCQHNAPALFFSTGGPSDNTFHTFSEIVIPLFITSRHFEGRVKFVISDYRPRWVRKFIQVLKKLTNYDLIDADADETVHCFPAAVVGLRYYSVSSLWFGRITKDNTIYITTSVITTRIPLMIARNFIEILSISRWQLNYSMQNNVLMLDSCVHAQ